MNSNRDHATDSKALSLSEASNGQGDLPRQRFYDVTEHRIRSFVTRTGRISDAQIRALSELGPMYMIPYQKSLLDFNAVFERPAPVILEIGFGMGETSATISATLRDKNFLGVEVHTPGVGNLLKLTDAMQLKNQKIIQHDAFEVLTHMIAENALDGVHIYFPDPWHKARHHKRRLIQAPFVKLLVSRMKIGAYLHLATDWEDYAVQMLEVLSNEKALNNTATDVSGYAERPDYRPVTKFENRGLKLGHGVWDLVFVKGAHTE